ncbi:hypothetical protein LTS18_010979 [Coniosporium uncinatum]|uniref:Uncharacterized protein n=1 Tax=Coniosporium uncinatum TaxID=93489 RepID=A0ACC3DWB4_9PEZI|nr:hypothetical protein LTS18_010979 [Coniosporium uncinatum]
MGSNPPSNLRASLARDGYILILSTLKQDQLERLRSACAEVTQLARGGKWPHIRTLPKQFPPWPSDSSHGIWGVQHLLHPSLPHSTTFAESYFGDAIVKPVKELLQCEEDDLVMELCNMLVHPDEDFELRWHRDDIQPTATAAEEEAVLSEPVWHAQWNLALFEDKSLVVVPGSHKRARTNAEREADAYEPNMPGQRVVYLQPGDLMFYNNNILHRGIYDSTAERMTLHGTMGRVGEDPARARNVLQHGVGRWVEECDFSKLDEKLKQRAEGMRNRLLDMGKANAGVTYSQVDP